MSKLISVCIPVYNGDKYLEKTLKSLVNQTYKNLEILIGDNGSVDNTEKIVKKFQKIDNRIKYIKNNENLGYFGNCNNLISKSLGKYIAIYHADDIYDLKIIEKQVNSLEKNIDIIGVFTFENTINELDEIIGSLIKNKYTKSKVSFIKLNLKEYLSECLNKGNFLICPTGMIKAEIYKNVKYSSSVKYVEDMDMWIQLLKIGNLGIINEKLINYRIHSQQA
ncbi:MAG: glycosyltransferase family 2 protein, partial [Fusobacteriaceae bacterium]